MLHPDEMQPLIRSYSRLAPEAQALVREYVIARARIMRAELLRGLVRRLFDWRRRRKAIAQLQAFDDRTLKDMGLTRGEIESAVRGGDPHRSATALRPRCVA